MIALTVVAEEVVAEPLAAQERMLSNVRGSMMFSISICAMILALLFASRATRAALPTRAFSMPAPDTLVFDLDGTLYPVECGYQDHFRTNLYCIVPMFSNAGLQFAGSGGAPPRLCWKRN